MVSFSVLSTVPLLQAYVNGKQSLQARAMSTTAAYKCSQGGVVPQSRVSQIVHRVKRITLKDLRKVRRTMAIFARPSISLLVSHKLPIPPQTRPNYHYSYGRSLLALTWHQIFKPPIAYIVFRATLTCTLSYVKHTIHCHPSRNCSCTATYRRLRLRQSAVPRPWFAFPALYSRQLA
jgi:hypothetical protein